MIRLFKEIVSKNKQHPYFVHVSKNDDMKHILNLWATDFKDRDGKFAYEFQSTFNSSFWELYCFQIFKKLGFKIDFSKNSPDFVLNFNYLNFNIECTISNNDQDSKPEYDREEKLNPTYKLKHRVEYQAVRLLNSINSKEKKFTKTYEKFDFVKNNAFILALAPFEQAAFMDNASSGILKVLYGLSINDESEHYDNKIIKHKNGEDIELDAGIFTNDSYSNISGILFSNLATTGKLNTMSENNIALSMERRYNSNNLREDIFLNYFPNKETFTKHFGIEELKIFLEELDVLNTLKLNVYESNGVTESLEDGLSLYINPYANNKIDISIIEQFKKYNIAIHSFDTIEKCYNEVFIPNGFLIERNVLSLCKIPKV